MTEADSAAERDVKDCSERRTEQSRANVKDCKAKADAAPGGRLSREGVGTRSDSGRAICDAFEVGEGGCIPLRFPMRHLLKATFPQGPGHAWSGAVEGGALWHMEQQCEATGRMRPGHHHDVKVLRRGGRVVAVEAVFHVPWTAPGGLCQAVDPQCALCAQGCVFVPCSPAQKLPLRAPKVRPAFPCWVSELRGSSLDQLFFAAQLWELRLRHGQPNGVQNGEAAVNPKNELQLLGSTRSATCWWTGPRSASTCRLNPEATVKAEEEGDWRPV